MREYSIVRKCIINLFRDKEALCNLLKQFRGKLQKKGRDRRRKEKINLIKFGESR